MSFWTTMATALLLALGAILVLWAIKDAMSRGKSPLLVTIAVVFFFPFGLIAWLVFRPAAYRPHRETAGWEAPVAAATGTAKRRNPEPPRWRGSLGRDLGERTPLAQAGRVNT